MMIIIQHALGESQKQKLLLFKLKAYSDMTTKQPNSNRLHRLPRELSASVKTDNRYCSKQKPADQDDDDYCEQCAEKQAAKNAKTKRIRDPYVEVHSDGGWPIESDHNPTCSISCGAILACSPSRYCIESEMTGSPYTKERMRLSAAGFHNFLTGMGRLTIKRSTGR